jgi:tetratricopeptide (TPR) repeat protein
MTREKKTTAKRGRRSRKVSTIILTSQLAQLENAQLVRRLDEGEPAYSFKHTLTWEVAYESLLLKVRRDVHRHVAEAYERVYAERLDDYAALLAQHHAEAGDDAKALVYATHAGDQASRVYANNEAIAHYSLALQAAERSGASGEQLLHLFTKRGRAFELSDQYERALDNYNEMEKVARAHGDRSLELNSLVLRATIHSTATPVFSPTQAQQFSDQALILARELNDRAAEAKVVWNLLLLNRFTEQAMEAIRYGEQSLAIARELNLREQMAFILTDLGGAYMGAGRMDRAQVLLDEARGLWRELDNLPMLADNLMMSGTHSLMKGDYEQTLLFTEEGTQVSRSIGNIVSQASNQGTQTQVWLDRGKFADALRLIEENVRLAEKINSHMSLALGRSILAWLYGNLGAFERGLEMARVARTNLDQPMPSFFRAWAFSLLARFYILSDDLTAAAEALHQGEAGLSGEVMLSPSRLIGAIAVGELALAKGEFAQAVKAMDEFVATLRRFGIRLYLGDALYLEAKGLRGQGEGEQAFEILRQARAEAEALDARRILWQILATLSQIEEQRGNQNEAVKLRAQAREIVEYIAAHTPAELRASFLSLPKVQALVQ